MTLKQVVLPAPLGPMSPRISPLLMWKLTSLRATTPPKRSVTWSTSRSFSPSATTGTPTSSGVMSTSGLMCETSSVGSASCGSPDGAAVGSVAGVAAGSVVGVAAGSVVGVAAGVVSSSPAVGWVGSGTGVSFLEDGLSLVGLLGSDGPPWRQDPLRPEDREQHEGKAEDEHPEVGEVAEALREVGDHDRAEDHAPAVAG